MIEDWRSLPDEEAEKIVTVEDAVKYIQSVSEAA